MPIGILPQTESQARPLTKLAPEQQPAAWKRAVEIADGKQPTARQVDAAVVEIKNTIQDSTPVEFVPDSPTGESQSESPVGDLPKTERQTRPLTKLKDLEQQPEAWKRAVEVGEAGEALKIREGFGKVFQG